MGHLYFRVWQQQPPEVVGAAGAFAVEVVLPAAIIAGIATVVIATVYIGATATLSDIPVGLQEARKKGQLAMPGNATAVGVSESKTEEKLKDSEKSEEKTKPSNKPYKNSKEANKQAQKQGYKDAHELKEDYVGKKMCLNMI